MAEAFDPFEINISNSPSDPLKTDAEDNHEVSQIEAALAGVASGVLKIPEGFVSLGAELMDAFDLTENAAAKVEQVFDTINPFEEIAEQRAAGKITEALVSIGVPAGAGAKIASKLATKALKARKAGTYVNLKGKNVRKGMEKVYKLNDGARVQRFGAAVLGGAAGETLVADVEQIGTIGDALSFGPTQLEVDTSVDYDDELPEDSQKDAVRKLMNRVKFGADSVMYFPFIFGGIKAVGKVATYGKELALSSSKINKRIDKIASAVRPTSDKPTAMFLAKNVEAAGKAADTNFAIEQVKRIDKEVGKMFPVLKSFANGTGKANAANRELFYKDLKELMFEGNLNDKLGNTKIYNKIKKQMTDGGLNSKSQSVVFDSIYNSRQKFVNLLETIQEGSTAGVTLTKDMRDVAGLMGDRVKLMLGSTYKIFQNPVVDNLSSFKPVKEKVDKVKEILKRHALRNGRELTEDQLDYRINEILTNVTKFTKGTQLPSYKMTDVTIGAKTPDIRRNFQRILTKETGKGKKKITTTQVMGPGSKAFRELLGEVDDARQSIFNGIGLLSSLAKRSELIDGILKTNDDAIANKTTQLFYTDKNDAIKQLGAGGLNKIVELDSYLKPMFKDGVLLNRLKGLHTTEEIAEAFDPVNKISNYFVGPQKTGFSQGMSTAYKNLFLTPKAGAQVAKTVLSPTTHMRNFLSATGFSLANGTLFVNPKLFAEAAATAAKTVQFGLRSPKAMEEYREMLQLGVVNSNTKMGDYLSLLKDIGAAREGSNYADSMFKNMVRRLARLTEPAQQLYTLEDDVFKIYNFKVEKARLGNAYAKAGIKRTEQQLKEEAADIVRNTVPNYAYVSDVVKGLRSTPFGNFASFPSAIMNSAVGIKQRIFKEMRHSKPTKGSKFLPVVFEVGKGLVKNDNPLYGIGAKRMLGAATAFGSLGVGIGAGYQAIYGTTDRQLEALERWVAPFEQNDKKFIIKEVDENGKAKYFYTNWSNNNAYDYLEAPFRTLATRIQQGIETEDQLSRGFVKGISDAFKNFTDPFVSESIAPEAIIDIIIRGGVTDTGKKLYTDATPIDDQVRIAMKHILNTQIPLSKSQLSRIYYAAKGIPDPRGQEYDIEKELPGLLGWRQIEIDPIRGLSFKITNLNVQKRNATREFTGGDSKLLAGGVNTAEDIIRQFFITNRALFNSQQSMHLDLKAANEFEVEDEELAQVFDERGIPSNVTGPLFEGQFRPYVPSENIVGKFYQIDAKNNTQSMEQALPVITEMIEAFQNAPLDKQFKFKLQDFGIDMPDNKINISPNSFDPFSQSNLTTPPVNPDMVQPVQQASVSQTGLTPSEQALLSPEEQAIRLRQRGMA
jgi:hypothetical protein|tara:strand:- start:156 stop:4199 length:4044 start_codon:yes stop_codon:yes gene_type:complete